MPEFSLGPVTHRPDAVAEVLLAAGRHGHLIKLFGLVVIAIIVIIALVLIARWAVRRGRRRRLDRLADAAEAAASSAAPASAPPADAAPPGAASLSAAPVGAQPVVAPPADAAQADGQPGGRRPVPAAALLQTTRRSPDSVAASRVRGDVAVATEHLVKTYRMGQVTVRALDDVSLQIASGAMTCIMGKSGSGKSTLLRQLGLIDLPTGGRIWLADTEATGLLEHQRSDLRLRFLGYVFQEYALLPELTAVENVYLPAMMAGERPRHYRDRANGLLDLVGLGSRSGHRPRELSGGEQQRVAIARALVNEPRIVYADEPTANLDTAAARTVMETLQTLNESLGVTVVFVSHDPDDAQYASQLIRLADGKIRQPEPSEVL
jgi:putative ABC transport system ATP-binding protein